MSKYDFNKLLKVADRADAITGLMLDMWEAAVRVCPKWRGYWPGGNTLVEWLYNERPEIARSIERRHRLFQESDDAPLDSPPTYVGVNYGNNNQVGD